MQIAKSTDYALRTLMYAASRPDEIVTQTEVADFYQISREHLRKIIHELAKSGYLDTRRGKSGGFKLASAPETIGIGEIVRLFEKEQESEIVACEATNCALKSNCRMRNVFIQAEQNFYAALDDHSIADMLTPATRRILLQPAPVTTL